MPFARVPRPGNVPAQGTGADRAYAAAKDRGEFGTGPQTRSLRVAVEAATRIYQALADWAEWAQTVSPAVPAGDDDPGREASSR